MSAAGISVLSASTSRLYPKPYVRRPAQVKQEGKAGQKVKEPFADLEQLLSLSAATLQVPTLPSHRWTHTATGSPVGTPHSLFLAQQNLVVVFFANRLQVYNISTSVRLFEFVFESENGDTKWPVSDVVECQLHPQGNNTEAYVECHTILVSVMTANDKGKIYLIDYVNARTLVHMEVPFVVTKMLPAWSPTEWMPQQQAIVTPNCLFDKFVEPLVIGTRGGVLVVLDLHFDHNSLDDERRTERWTEEVQVALAQYDPEIWKRRHKGMCHPWFDMTFNFVNPDNMATGLFDYLSPRPGEFVGRVEEAQQVPRESVSITALHLLWPSPPSYSPPADSSASMEVSTPSDATANSWNDTRTKPANWIPGLLTPLVVVGYNFGVFQIWALDTMELLYCSPITESRAAITTFETQSLHETAISTKNENKLLLWVGRGSISTSHTQQAHAPNIACYGVSLIKNSADGVLLGTNQMPTQLSDCLSSVVAECITTPGSPYDGEYFGQILSIKTLPCWESPALDNSCVSFVFETFPLNSVSVHQPNLAISKQHESIPMKSVECHILSTASLQLDQEQIFPNQDNLLALTVPYQMDPLTKDQSNTLAFSIIPSSVQGFFPESQAKINAPQLSFEALAVTSEAVWRLGYSSHGQQLLTALMEHGPAVFDHPELIQDQLNQLGWAIPASTDDYYALREQLFDLALHNNLSCVITDYVLEGAYSLSAGIASLALNTSSTANLFQVLNWARSNYRRVVETIDELAGQVMKARTDESGIMEIQQAKRLLNDLYNIIKSLLLRYQYQKQKWETQQSSLEQDLEKVVKEMQLLDCLLWCVHHRAALLSYDAKTFKQKITLRRAKAEECARNSPTQWNVTFNAEKTAPLDTHGNESSRLSVFPKAFDPTIDGKLIIDLLLASLSTEGEVNYPPDSIDLLLALCHTGSSLLISSKQQIIYYFLLDLEPSLAVDFGTRLMMTPAEQLLIRGYHAIDSHRYDEAVAYLNNAQVTNIISDEMALRITRKLCDAHAFSQALSFYRLRQPPIDSLDAAVLALYVLLCNGLVSEAFFLIRGQSRTTLDSYDPALLHTLLFHYFNHSYNNNVLKDIFQLPFDAIESESLKHFLLHTADQAKAVDLYLMFLLQHHRVAEAVAWYHTYNPWIVASSDRDNELMKAHLLNNYIRALPPVVRTGLKMASLQEITSRTAKPPSTLPSLGQLAINHALAGNGTVATIPQATPTKKTVTKLFGSAQRNATTAPNASLGPALLSPTTPGKFARSPALFRPAIVLSTPSKPTDKPTDTTTTVSNGDATLPSAVDSVKTSLFSPLSRELHPSLRGSPRKQAQPLRVPVNTAPAQNEATPLPITSSISQTPAPLIISYDSLLVDNEHPSNLPTAPMSTPTKKVMDAVVQRAEEVSRQARAIQHDPEDDDIVVLDDDDFVDPRELNVNGGYPSSDEDRAMVIDLESEIDDETLEQIRGANSAEESYEEVEEDEDQVEEESEHEEEGEEEQPEDEDVTAIESEASHAGPEGMDVTDTQSEMESVSQAARSSTSRASRPSRASAKPIDYSVLSTRSRASQSSSAAASKASAASKVSKATSKASKVTASTKASSSQASKASKTRGSSKISAKRGMPAKPMPSVPEEVEEAHEAAPIAGRRSARRPRMEVTEEPQDVAPATSRRSTRRTASQASVVEQPMEEEIASSTSQRSSRRSSRLSNLPQPPTMPTIEETSDKEGSAREPSAASRRSSRLSTRAEVEATPPSDEPLVIEPLGVHPETAEDDGEDKADSDGDSDISGDTARVRRSTRKGAKVTKTASSTTTSSAGPFTRSRTLRQRKS